MSSSQEVIVLEVPQSESYRLDEIRLECPSAVHLGRIKRFGGAPDMLQAAIFVTTATLPFLTKIIVEAIKARSSITVKHKGTEVRGMKPKEVSRLLKELCQDISGGTEASEQGHEATGAQKSTGDREG